MHTYIHVHSYIHICTIVHIHTHVYNYIYICTYIQALIGREIVQVEEMLTKISKTDKKEEGTDEEVSRATSVKEEANKVVQLVDSLYSPRQESQQYEAINHRIQDVIEREVEQLYAEYVQENIEKMVTQSVKACPSFLDDTVSQRYLYLYILCIC